MLVRNLLLIAGALAVLIGISITAFLVFSAAPPARGGARAGSLSILVAARDLPSGSVLRDTDLTWKTLESRAAPPLGLSRLQVSATQFIGSVTRRYLAAGQVVGRDAVFDRNGPRVLAAVLSPGYRAVTIDVDAAQGGAGLILPDDRVDVILASQTAGFANVSRAPRVTTVLRDIRVVAVDRAVQRPNASAALPEPKLDANTAAPKTIALEVTARDAERLLLAAQAGKLQLSLRSLAKGSESPDVSADSLEEAGDGLRASSSPGSPRRPRSNTRRLGAAGADPAVGAPILILRGSKAAAQ